MLRTEQIIIDHDKYMKKVKTMSMESLLFTIRDCKDALNAMPDNPKSGYYQDEIHYCAMEINRRKNGK